jgi:hypothetical protein
MAIGATYIKEKYVGWIRWALLIVFSLVAMFFSLFLFWNFPSKDYLRPVYSVLGLFWEAGTLYFAIQLKTAVTLKKKSWTMWLIMYLTFVSVSLFGGIGFNIATTGDQAAVVAETKAAAKTANDSIKTMHDSLQKKVDATNDDVATYEAMLLEIPKQNLDRLNQVTKWKKTAVQAASDAALELKKFDDEQAAVIAAASEPASTSGSTTAEKLSSSIDVFGALGDLLGLGSADKTRKLFFIIIVIVIQIIVLISSPIIADPQADQVDVKGLMKFIDALFELGSSKRLASPYRVAKQMGLTPRERDSYTAMLTTMIYRNEAILKQGRGGTTTDYDQASFKKIVMWILTHPKSDVEEGTDEKLSGNDKT